MTRPSLDQDLSRSRQSRWVGVLAVCVLAQTLHGCAEQRCLFDGDCPDGKLCRDAECRVPQCESHAECGEGEVCERRFCVAGCAAQQDCDEGATCLYSRCRLLSETCGCPLAPELCAEDVNPSSPTAGQPVCVNADSAALPRGMGLFFGSLKCSICRTLFARLLGVREQMRASVEPPLLIFVHLKDVPISAGQIEQALGQIDAATVSESPVLLDSDSLRIWQMHAASWYDFAIVSASGCFTHKYAKADLIAESLAPVQQTWTDAAADSACIDASL